VPSFTAVNITQCSLKLINVCTFLAVVMYKRFVYEHIMSNSCQKAIRISL